MAIVGYCRCSSSSQSLELQEEQLREAGAEKLFSEKRTGTSRDGRAELAAALDWVRTGDVFLVTRLDRCARSFADLCWIVDTLTAKGVGFRALQQGAVDTTRPEGRLMLHMLAAFAQFETDLRRDRQLEGIAKAKSEGRYRGRPPSIDRGSVMSLKGEGLGASAIAERLGIARASVYRLLAQPA